MGRAGPHAAMLVIEAQHGVFFKGHNIMLGSPPQIDLHIEAQHHVGQCMMDVVVFHATTLVPGAVVQLASCCLYPQQPQA